MYSEEISESCKGLVDDFAEEVEGIAKYMKYHDQADSNTEKNIYYKMAEDEYSHACALKMIIENMGGEIPAEHNTELMKYVECFGTFRL